MATTRTQWNTGVPPVEGHYYVQWLRADGSTIGQPEIEDVDPAGAGWAANVGAYEWTPVPDKRYNRRGCMTNKLTEGDLKTIRLNVGVPSRDLARQLGCSKSTVLNARRAMKESK